MLTTILALLTIVLVLGCPYTQIESGQGIEVLQLTFDPRNHYLDNNDNFSPDDQWLVYDTRKAVPDPPVSEIGANSNIEKVNVNSGEIVVLYETENQTEHGPGVGAASYHPTENKIVCMHGLLNCNASRPYWFWRRTGVAVDESQPGKPIFLDARDLTPPFTPGALRGGTHRHEWSADGQWIGFTYNDAIMAEIEKRTGQPVNLRTIGVSTSLRPVKVDKDPEGENNDGMWFSALVVKVVPSPKPGSDEISRAFSDAWVGTKGYRKPDDTWQRARAFLGKLRTKEGKELVEVFIVDIPNRIDVPGDDGPLEGTKTTMPMPPKGTKQRRLTYTENRKYAGVVIGPRHWVRSSPDGSRISFLAKDDNGVTQVFFVSPLGGEPVQVTHHNSPIQSTVRWNPDGNKICYVCDNIIFTCDVRKGASFGRARRMTTRTDESPLCPVWSHDGKMIAFNRLVQNGKKWYKQVFLLRL
ncbi:Tol-Pal system protein TolB [subsurface metagenome]